MKKNKLQSKHGFSLVEMLTAVLILALMLSFLGGGIVVVKNAYENITLKAEARTLLSTAITSISTELQQAKDIQNKVGTNGTYISFYNTGREYRMSLQNKNDNIYIVPDVGTETIPLLTDKTITNELIPYLTELEYDGNTFRCIVTINYKGNIYEKQEIYIRPINEQ